MTSVVALKKRVEKAEEKVGSKPRDRLVIATWEGCYDMFDGPWGPHGKRDCNECEECVNSVRKGFLAKKEVE